MLFDCRADVAHDLGVDLEKIVAAHPGPARRPRCNDAAIGAFDILDVGTAEYLGIDAHYGCALGHIERLALGQAFDDVIQDYVAEFAQETQVRTGSAHVAGADEGNFSPSHG